MILRFRMLFEFFILLSLFSCGGGGSLSRDASGNTGGGTVAVTRSITLVFTDASGQLSTVLSESTPLTLTATAIDSNGDPVTDTLITYIFQPEGLAIFGNNSGTSSTGTDGIAIIQVLVGESSGAGAIIATLSSGETASTTFNSAGTTGTVDDTVTRSIELVLTDKLTGEVSAELSQASSLELTATAIDSNGSPVTANLISYTFQPEGLAVFGNDSGTARTGSDGEAIIDILVGENSGSGEIVATLSSGETATATFNSSGNSTVDETVTRSIQLLFTDKLTGTESDELSAATPLSLTASVRDSNDNPVISSLITYMFQPEGLAVFGNDSGTVRTGSDGIAILDILVGNNSGAGQITAILSSGETNIIAFNSAGDADDGTVTRSIQLELTDSLTGAISNELSEETPLTLTTSVNDSNGEPIADTLITYTFVPEGLAIFGNDSGTASTDAGGVSIIEVLVAGNSGAGKIIATLSSGETASTTFNSAGTTAENAEPFSLDLFGSSTLLASSGSDEIELIALVKDINNVLLEGVNVTFSVNSGASLRLENNGSVAVTGGDGIARAFLNTQNKPENRSITVTATVSGLAESKTLDVQVVGTVIAVNGSPSVILGATAEFTVFLADFDGVGIANQTIQISSTNGNEFDSSEFMTDSEGQLTVNYTANNSGVDVITASALNASGILNISVQQDQFSFTDVSVEDIPLGEPSNIELTWLKDTIPFANGAITLTTTRGSLTTANVTTDMAGMAFFQIQSSNAGRAVVSAQGIDTGGNIVNATIEIEFVAVNVNNIILSASRNSIGPAGQKSTITAVLRDIDGNLVKGKTVNFNADDVSGGEISPASAITGSNGLASTVYTSLNVTTENGIIISATELDSGIEKNIELTVADRAQFISIGTGNIIEAPDVTSYLKKFTVFVTDANSNPISGVELTVTGTPVKHKELLVPNSSNIESRPAFYKGYWNAFPNTENFDFWIPVQTLGCANEDIDDDAILDFNEDKNGDNELTPGNIVSIDGNIITDENGQAIIELRYAKTFAGWGQIKITASTPVSGSESQASQFFTLSASAEDLRKETTPPNSNPFGTGQNLMPNPLFPRDGAPNPDNINEFIDDGANLNCENTL